MGVVLQWRGPEVAPVYSDEYLVSPWGSQNFSTRPCKPFSRSLFASNRLALAEACILQRALEARLFCFLSHILVLLYTRPRFFYIIASAHDSPPEGNKNKLRLFGIGQKREVGAYARAHTSSASIFVIICLRARPLLDLSREIDDG